jgi:phosphatidate cytidylyltransferase
VRGRSPEGRSPEGRSPEGRSPAGRSPAGRSPELFPFLQRALVTFTLGPLALYLIYLGSWFYFLPVAALLLIGTIEYADLARRLGWRPSLWLLLPAVSGQWVAAQWPGLNLFGPFMALSLLAVLCYALWLYERRLSETAVADWFTMMVGILYLGWLGGHFFRLRGLDLGTAAWQWTALAMLVIWVADSMAYLVGKQFGRRKLSPRLSPNKTIEGYVGGILGGTLAALLLALWFQLPPGFAVIIGATIAIVSPAGDLAISLLKREARVKDSGHFLPGHGGALDRIDSLVWAVFIAYHLLTLTTF